MIGQYFDGLAKATNYCLSPTNDGICVKCLGNYCGLIISGSLIKFSQCSFFIIEMTLLTNYAFLSALGLKRSWNNFCFILIIVLINTF